MQRTGDVVKHNTIITIIIIIITIMTATTTTIIKILILIMLTSFRAHASLGLMLLLGVSL